MILVFFTFLLSNMLTLTWDCSSFVFPPDPRPPARMHGLAQSWNSWELWLLEYNKSSLCLPVCLSVYLLFFIFLAHSLDLKGICPQEVANGGSPVYNNRSSWPGHSYPSLRHVGREGFPLPQRRCVHLRSHHSLYRSFFQFDGDHVPTRTPTLPQTKAFTFHPSRHNTCSQKRTRHPLHSRCECLIKLHKVIYFHRFPQQP